MSRIRLVLPGNPRPHGAENEDPCEGRHQNGRKSHKYRLVGSARPTPFVLSTPHHSTAWTQSYPEAYQASLAEYEQALGQYEDILNQIDQAYQQGQLGQAELQQALAIYREYEALRAEYEQLAQQGSEY